MSTVRVTLEAAGDLPEPVREALQALITAATADGMGVEYSCKPSAQVASKVGGHVSSGELDMHVINTFSELSSEVRNKRIKAMEKAMNYGGR